MENEIARLNLKCLETFDAVVEGLQGMGLDIFDRVEGLG
jgi:hypothetical protein